MIICQKKGFSLVELMVVIAVSAILMAIAVPTFLGARNNADASACRANLEIIRTAIKEWALDNPDTVSARAADPDVADRVVMVQDIDTYIDGGFVSLEEPTTGNSIPYANEAGVAGQSDDVVAIIETTGEVNDPDCNTGISGHSL